MMLSKFMMQARASMMGYQRMNFATGVTLTPKEKDYYKILNVPTSATNEQIKDSYRQLAKKYHPDARAVEAQSERDPNPDKFRDVVEAYQILSIRESRANYDLLRRKNPDNYTAMSQFEFDLEKRPEARDDSAQVPIDAPKRGSYAEDRLNQLKNDRAKYTVNHLGYYKGGVPRKDAGALRGKSLGNPGEFHSPQVHNYLNYNHQDTAFVTQEDAVKFKHWMNSDIVDFQRSKPYYPMHYDRDFNFLKDRSYWAGLLFLMTAGVYFKLKFHQETNRWSQWDRTEKLQEVKPHHVSHRGGVLLGKEFLGFEKYHQNNESLMNWYKNAYPQQFASAESK